MTMDDKLSQRNVEIAACVEAYEEAWNGESSDLKRFLENVSPENHAAALAELACVEMSLCRRAGASPKTAKQYVNECPEILNSAQCYQKVIAKELVQLKEDGQIPTAKECGKWFPGQDMSQIADLVDTISLADGRSNDDATACPSRIGRYEVQSELGSGGFGRVYLCFDPVLECPVAVKLPHPPKRSEGNRPSEIHHEAKIAAKLQHPGIVTVRDMDKLWDGRSYIVYEFVPGQTLRDRIKQGKINRSEAIDWVLQVAWALDHAHSQEKEVVHRDVSPANILLNEDGRAQLTDFGLARVDGKYHRNDSGHVVGKLAYMPPEQAAGDAESINRQSDIYSLGAILYELLTGKRPLEFEGNPSFDEIVGRIRFKEPTPVRKVDWTIRPALAAIAHKAMAKKPAERYSTAGEMARDLWKAQHFWRNTFSRVAMVGCLMVMALSLRGIAIFASRPAGLDHDPPGGDLHAQRPEDDGYLVPDRERGRPDHPPSDIKREPEVPEPSPVQPEAVELSPEYRMPYNRVAKNDRILVLVYLRYAGKVGILRIDSIQTGPHMYWLRLPPPPLPGGSRSQDGGPPVDTDDLKEMVAFYHENVLGFPESVAEPATIGKPNPEAEWSPSSARQITDILLPQTLRKYIQDNEFQRVIIVPGKALARLPFHALVVSGDTEDKPEYLVEDETFPPIGYVSSLDKLKSMWAVEEPNGPRDGFVVLGGRITGAREALDVSTILEGVVPGAVHRYVGWRSIERLVFPQLANCRILHYADETVHPLAMQLGNSSPIIPSLLQHHSHNGALEIPEIMDEGPGLNGCELAVFSSCESYELGEQCLEAGVEVVVSSLWKVNDTTTSELMVTFYEEIAPQLKNPDEPVDYPKALHKAMLQVRNRPGCDKPYYWAPFVPSGAKLVTSMN